MEQVIGQLVVACWAIAIAVGLVFMVGCWITYTLLRGVNEIIRGMSALDEHLAQIAAHRTHEP